MHLLILFLSTINRMRQTSLGIFFLFTLLACDKQDVPQANIHKPASVPILKDSQLADGSYCFSQLYNQDITDIQLTILGSAVSGFMNWIPHQKDGARGTLQGFKNASGELDLLYDYVIEGSQQTETKLMKIKEGKLLVKRGELQDLKYDGNLTYKDVSQAKYLDVLQPVNCK
jgi:hypothetical protein